MWHALRLQAGSALENVNPAQLALALHHAAAAGTVAAIENRSLPAVR